MQNENKINAVICCSPLETTQIANDKKLTYETFADYKFVPKIYKNEKDLRLLKFLRHVSYIIIRYLKQKVNQMHPTYSDGIQRYTIAVHIIYIIIAKIIQ